MSQSRRSLREWKYKGRMCIVQRYICSGETSCKYNVYVETKLKDTPLATKLGIEPENVIEIHSYIVDFRERTNDKPFFGENVDDEDPRYHDPPLIWTIKLLVEEAERFVDAVIDYEKKYGAVLSKCRKFLAKMTKKVNKINERSMS